MSRLSRSVIFSTKNDQSQATRGAGGVQGKGSGALGYGGDIYPAYTQLRTYG
jgi:hypothetical protein